MGIVSASGAGELFCSSMGGGAGILLPHSLSPVMTVSVFPTQYVAGTVDLVNCSLQHLLLANHSEALILMVVGINYDT
jgi:hypothetical protein